MRSMTPEQALKILIQATATIKADRDTHKVIEEALAVLERVIKGEEEK